MSFAKFFLTCTCLSKFNLIVLLPGKSIPLPKRIFEQMFPLLTPLEFSIKPQGLYLQQLLSLEIVMTLQWDGKVWIFLELHIIIWFSKWLLLQHLLYGKFTCDIDFESVHKGPVCYFRDLDRERAKLEQQEKKVIADIKKMAKLGQMVSYLQAKVLAI